jgi:CRP/FNR family transcriptional regulator, anaerobic regulatory protein
MELLLGFLEAIHPLSPGLTEFLSKNVRKASLTKNEYLLKAGKVCKNVCFIEKGLFRCFYKEHEADVSSWFMCEGDVIFSVESFYEQKPSYENIQALEDCTYYYITYDELQYIYTHYPEFNFIGRVLTEKYYRFLWNYVYNTKMKQGPERYQLFVETFPQLANRIPLQDLATYLGITPVWLSKIRSQL